jgi:hypothetical protein
VSIGAAIGSAAHGNNSTNLACARKCAFDKGPIL